MRFKRLYTYILVALVAFGTAGYFLFRNNDSAEIKYRTERVTRGDIVVQVRATGTINPVRTVQVGSQVSGSIARIYVDFNSVVKAGQVIALIDSTFLAASVKEAEANRERNQAQVNEAERSLKRMTELFKKDLASQAEYDAARAAYESAIAQLKQSQAALDRARVNLRYSVIRAPIDGVVISRDVDVGQTVAASLQAPQLFLIANDLKSMQVEASVDEADIGQVREGQTVLFTVDAYPEQQFRGTVTQVRLAPVTVQNVVTYTVIIEVPNQDMRLRPGMTATVSILVDRRNHVLRVPTLALRFQPSADVLEDTPDSKVGETKPGDADQRRMMRRGEGGTNRDGPQRNEPGVLKKTARLWIMEGGKTLRPVTVETGLSDNRYAEILGDALKEGGEVVIGMMGTEGGALLNPQTNPFAPRMPGGGGRTRF